MALCNEEEQDDFGLKGYKINSTARHNFGNTKHKIPGAKGTSYLDMLVKSKMHVPSPDKYTS